MTKTLYLYPLSVNINSNYIEIKTEHTLPKFNFVNRIYSILIQPTNRSELCNLWTLQLTDPPLIDRITLAIYTKKKPDAKSRTYVFLCVTTKQLMCHI